MRTVFQGDEKGEDGKGKVKVRHIDLPIEMRGHGLSQKDLDNALEKEVKFYIRLIYCSFYFSVWMVYLVSVIRFFDA